MLQCDFFYSLVIPHRMNTSAQSIIDWILMELMSLMYSFHVSVDLSS